ncbi:membrane protein [Alloalcanivorax gelatiniphagus]
MSHLTEAEAVIARPTPGVSTAALRNLYAARFAFAIAWAGLLATNASELSPFTVTLLVLYPLVDLGAAVYDLRSSAASRQRVPLLVNMALSLATAIGLGVAIDSGIPDVLRVWGAWAITAGAVQLIVGAQRRALGGQWPMILSGGISVLAGGSFVAMASGDNASLASLAGYATLGGIFFAVSAFRLHRSTARVER